MTEIQKVLAEARRLAVPTPADESEVGKVGDKMLARVSATAQKHAESTGVLLGGSFAKGTWLPGDVDIDVFVKMKASVDEKAFEEVGLAVGREAVKGYRFGKKYAQHPYTEATVDGIKVNVVPCYDVAPGRWKSAADRSPYHVAFVRENLDAEARQQVRLLKRFMRSIGVYGAEIEREGFSGYAAEVLVHREKDFEGVLRMFSSLKITDGGPFSLLDPIDRERDLGKAISRESVARMTLGSRAFLEAPSLKFFRPVSGRLRKSLAERAYAIVFEHEELSEDTLWGELKRSTKQLVKHLEERGFEVARASPASDARTRSAMILLPAAETLPDLEERVGPAVGLADGVKKFTSKNRGKAELIWAGEDGRLRLLQRRRFTRLDDILEEIMGSGMGKIGASAEVARAVSKNGRLLRGRKLLREAEKRRWLEEGLRRVISDSLGA